MKMLKKLSALLAAGALCFTFTACGSDAGTAQQDQNVGMANPITECSEEDLYQYGYVGANYPDDASDFKYYTIDAEGIAGVSFSSGGVGYDYRVANTVGEPTDINDLSGLFPPFTEENVEAEVAGRAALVSWTDGGTGKICWTDVVPGLSYSLVVSTGASKEALVEAANELFEEAQGDA